MKTAKELLIKYAGDLFCMVHSTTCLNIVSAMEEYASQFKSPTKGMSVEEAKGKNRYSVSLVYQKQGVGIQENAIRVLVTDAENEEQALGLGINEFEKEMVNFLLSMKVVIPIHRPSQLSNEEKEKETDAVEFAEWLQNKGYKKTGSWHFKNGKTQYDKDGDVEYIETFTIQQLYAQFKSHSVTKKD